MKQIPEKFWERLQSFHTKEEFEILQNWLNKNEENIFFRINTLKSDSLEIENILTQNNIIFEKIWFIPNAYIIKNYAKKTLWDLDIYKDGKIYMQSFSSQIPVLHLWLFPGNKVLDITSAPGSKTSQIAAVLKNTWEIIANDNNAIRIDKLKFTLKRQWVNNTSVIKMDARKIPQNFKEEYFDNILADLPCSAEWRINLHIEKSFWFWSEENILKNAQLQKEILEKNIPLLKRWGTLVYSTCTLAPEENEEVVTYILEKFPELHLENIDSEIPYLKRWIWNFWEKSFHSEIHKTIRCLPSEMFEWFYIAKFKKD